jgi:hypothetical protein
MFHKTLIAGGAGLMVLASASFVLSADVTGTVLNDRGQPVSGIRITVQTMEGKVVGQGVTDATGRYTIGEVTPGTYDYVLDPAHTGYKAGAAVSQLDADGMTLNSMLSKSNSPITLASKGATNLSSTLGLPDPSSNARNTLSEGTRTSVTSELRFNSPPGVAGVDPNLSDIHDRIEETLQRVQQQIQQALERAHENLEAALERVREALSRAL